MSSARLTPLWARSFGPTVLARGLLQRGDQFRCGGEEAVLLRLGAADLDRPDTATPSGTGRSGRSQILAASTRKWEPWKLTYPPSSRARMMLTASVSMSLKAIFQTCLKMVPASTPPSTLTSIPIVRGPIVRGNVLGDPVVASFLELLLQRQVGDPVSLIARPVGPYRVIERPAERLLCFPARALQRAG